MQNIGTSLAERRLSRGFKQAAAAWMSRPFPAKTGRRVVIFHDPNRISYSQLYPFFHYRKAFRDRFGVEFRALPIQDLLDGKLGLAKQADEVFIQPWFRIEPDALSRACARIQKANPVARLTFLDSFAHNDLRLSNALPDEVQFYLKKSLYVDKTHYQTCFKDTFMSEFYADLYDIDEPVTDFRAPPSLLSKLRLSPNFFTAPHLIGGFEPPCPPRQKGRELDIQLRLGRNGSPWYSAMRQKSQSHIEAISGISISGTNPLSLAEFNAELRNARLCFSPFGYGEVCWRDIEAIQAGSVLIKQDMSHLQTLPNLYEPGMTYLPVKWDFSDLEDVIRTALADQDRLQTIADQAYMRVRDYISNQRFVDDMQFLFAS